jgi:hypothetical protein
MDPRITLNSQTFVQRSASQRTIAIQSVLNDEPIIERNDERSSSGMNRIGSICNASKISGGRAH